MDTEGRALAIHPPTHTFRSRVNVCEEQTGHSAVTLLLLLLLLPLPAGPVGVQWMEDGGLGMRWWFILLHWMPPPPSRLHTQILTLFVLPWPNWLQGFSCLQRCAHTHTHAFKKKKKLPSSPKDSMHHYKPKALSPIRPKARPSDLISRCSFGELSKPSFTMKRHGRHLTTGDWLSQLLTPPKRHILHTHTHPSLLAAQLPSACCYWEDQCQWRKHVCEGKEIESRSQICGVVSQFAACPNQNNQHNE